MESGDDTHFHPQPPPPNLPDYRLLRRIGSGSFGEIWLGQANATERYRAIKLVYSSRFKDRGPYEMEFAGLKLFEEVSREHPGFVDILHISRSEEHDYFLCVMELADDLECGQNFAPQQYRSSTLTEKLAVQAHLPVPECVRIGTALAEALADLHGRGLVHRDIKPSNILFIRNVPKLADVGLVTEAMLKPGTLVPGTLDYMDYDIHGTTQGDLYSLGKVLYVMATGQPAGQFPERSSNLNQDANSTDFKSLEKIYTRACAPDRSRRYPDAESMAHDLSHLETLTGPHGSRWKQLERWVARGKRYGPWAATAVIAAGLLFLGHGRQLKLESEMRERRVGALIAYGSQFVGEQDYAGALPWFAEAMRLDQSNPAEQSTHRLRLTSVLERCPSLTQMWFREPEVQTVSFAGEENQILIPEDYGHWSIHDLTSGLPMSPVFGDGKPEELAAFSPQSDWAATVDFQQPVIKLWETHTGKALPSITNEHGIQVLALSRDGKLLAAADTNHQILLWQLPERLRLGQFSGHTTNVLGLAISPDGRFLASSGEDNLAILWNVADGRISHSLTSHNTWVYSVAFSPDSRLLATTSHDGTVRVWNVTEGMQTNPPLRHGDGVYQAQFSHDGQWLASASFDYVVRVWNLRTSLPEFWLRHNNKPVAAAFSPSDQQVVTLDHGGTVRIWSIPSQPLPRTNSWVVADSSSVFLQVSNHTIRIHRDPNETAIGQTNLGPDSIEEILLTDGGRRFVAITAPTNGPPQARLWKTWPSEPLGPAITLNPNLTRRVLDARGNTLVEFRGRGVNAWELTSGNRLLHLDQSAQIASLDAFGKSLALGISKNCEVWQIRGGPPRICSSASHSNLVQSLVWSPNGRHLVVAGQDYSLMADAAQIWEPETGNRVGQPLQHRDGILSVSFSSDGRKVVTSSEDFTAILWDAETGRQIAPPLRHPHQVIQADFSDDNRWLATICRDHTARMWHATTGEPITPPFPHSERLVKVVLLKQHRLLMTRGASGQTYLWPLPEDQRPADDFLLIAQILSGQNIQAAETTTFQTRASLRSLWEQARQKHPGDFSLKRR